MLKNRFMKKIVFTLGFALIGTFVFGNDQFDRRNPDITCSEVEAGCGEFGVFCWFTDEPIVIQDIKDFEDYMCSNIPPDTPDTSGEN